MGIVRYARLLQDYAKDTPAAEAIYQRVLATSRGDADLMFDYGRLLDDAKGDALSAERWYRRALQVSYTPRRRHATWCWVAVER